MNDEQLNRIEVILGDVRVNLGCLGASASTLAIEVQDLRAWRETVDRRLYELGEMRYGIAELKEDVTAVQAKVEELEREQEKLGAQLAESVSWYHGMSWTLRVGFGLVGGLVVLILDHWSSIKRFFLGM